MSQLSSSTATAKSTMQTIGNQLVVVVIKAQDLPNRRKLDKQSPYVVGRIQDQTQRTKVVPRGGQTPHFDEEMWFSLDNVESTTMSLMVYHQQKKDSELVCQAEIDFSTALRRSVTEGYDAWFDLQYKNKSAGRIYLEITYYPSANSVPIAVEQVPGDARFKTLTKKQEELRNSNLSASAQDFSVVDRIKQMKNMRKPLMTSYQQDLPDLPHLDSGDEYEEDDRATDLSSFSEPSSLHNSAKGKPQMQIPSVSVSTIDPQDMSTMGTSKPDNSFKEKFMGYAAHAGHTVHGADHSDRGNKLGGKGWFTRMIDNAYNLNKTMPSFFGAEGEFKRGDFDDFKIGSHRNKFQRQLESPQLVLDVPRNLFVDSSDEEDPAEDAEDMQRLAQREQSRLKEEAAKTKAGGSEMYSAGQRVEFQSSTKSRESAHSSHPSPAPLPTGRKLPSPPKIDTEKWFNSEDDDSDDDSDDVLSMNSSEAEKRLSSLRESFRLKMLPDVKAPAVEKTKAKTSPPPPPPRHLIPTGSLFDSGRTQETDSDSDSDNDFNFNLHSGPALHPLPKTAQSPLNFSKMPQKASRSFSGSSRKSLDPLPTLAPTPPRHTIKTRNTLATASCRDETMSYSQIRKMRLMNMLD